MTREEVIRRMEFCRDFMASNYSDMGEPNVTAFNMAITALEQEPILNKIRDEIEQEQKDLESCPSKDNDVYCEINACKRHIAIIDKYKAESEDKE